jgi:DNA-binding response OmpR family regulator
MLPQKPAILVVDDEVDTCSNLSDILTDLGYQVDVAYDGLSALELVKRRAYDIALLDLKMPGMNGLELYQRIKELRAGTVAIIVTAYATDETATAALEAGAWRIVAKPVDFAQLMSLVDEAAGQPLVIVIDDDHDLCLSLWDVLREHNFRVSLARDSAEAARQLRETRFDVALIDMKLPETSGSQIFQLVRETNPQARTVVITGFRSEMENLVQQVLTAGADAVCYKPFDVRSLLNTVSTLAAQRR